jgi:K+-transporting ATPase ATPase C chain
MRDHLRANLWLLGLTLLLCAVLYPLALLGIGQTVFREQAQGSLLTDEDGNVVGSRLIAQPFKAEEYFWPRPSAVDFNAAASGGSNLAANNPKLRQRVKEQLDALKPLGADAVPADMVTTSGSGLDPHITLANARYQAKYRVAKGWVDRIVKEKNLALSDARREQLRKQILDELNDLLERHAAAPLAGAAGVKLVNVLELNLAARGAMRELAATIH